jgi:hypothetical protein
VKGEGGIYFGVLMFPMNSPIFLNVPQAIPNSISPYFTIYFTQNFNL